MDIYRTITGIGMIVLLCACQNAGLDSTQSNSTTDQMNNNDKDYITQETARLNSLLMGFKGTLDKEEVAVDLSESGALYARGFSVEGKPIKSFAYLFESQDSHNAVYELLKGQHDEGKYYTLVSSNGGWLLWTYSEVEDPVLEYVIFDLVAAFAGEE